MKLMGTAITLLTAALGTALMAVPAAALPVSTASLAYTGTIDLNASSGLQVSGNMDAQYHTPPDGSKPYEFSTSLDFGAVSFTPDITVTTQEVVLIPGREICVLGSCYTTPDISLPSQVIDLAPSIFLSDPISVYDESYTTSNMPLGDIFTLDFGSPLLGEALTIDDLVQTQFETGATTINETGSIAGAFTSDYNYAGTLQPDGSTILGNYQLNVAGPGLLAELEAALLGLINDNTELLAEFALEALLATEPCGALPIGQNECNDFFAGVDASFLQVTVNSIGNFSTEFSLLKSISTVPTPATLPLVAFGAVLLGTVGRRRGRKARA